jgi:hypothetical protein
MALDLWLEKYVAIGEEITEPAMAASDISAEESAPINEGSRKVVWMNAYGSFIPAQISKERANWI